MKRARLKFQIRRSRDVYVRGLSWEVYVRISKKEAYRLVDKYWEDLDLEIRDFGDDGDIILDEVI